MDIRGREAAALKLLLSFLDSSRQLLFHGLILTKLSLASLVSSCAAPRTTKLVIVPSHPAMGEPVMTSAHL